MFRDSGGAHQTLLQSQVYEVNLIVWGCGDTPRNTNYCKAEIAAWIQWPPVTEGHQAARRPFLETSNVVGWYPAGDLLVLVTWLQYIIYYGIKHEYEHWYERAPNHSFTPSMKNDYETTENMMVWNEGMKQWYETGSENRVCKKYETGSSYSATPRYHYTYFYVFFWWGAGPRQFCIIPISIIN